MRARGELNHLERATQIDVKAAFFRFSIKRSGAMNDRIRGLNEAIVAVIRQAEFFACQIAAKKRDSRFDGVAEPRKIEMNLNRAPKPLAGFAVIARTDEQIGLLRRVFQQIRENVRANVAGRAGQEYGHGGWAFRTLPALLASLPRRPPDFLREARCGAAALLVRVLR